MKKLMKNISLRVTSEVFKEMKLHCVNQETTLQDYLTLLIKADLVKRCNNKEDWIVITSWCDMFFARIEDKRVYILMKQVEELEKKVDALKSLIDYRSRILSEQIRYVDGLRFGHQSESKWSLIKSSRSSILFSRSKM